MNLSKKCEYALKAMIELAIKYDRGQEITLIGDIAERENIPPRYLEQILLRLKNAGVLFSKRGVGGGYSLSRAPETITLSDIITVVDGPLSSQRQAKINDTAVKDEVTAVLYGAVQKVNTAVSGILSGISLRDISRQVLDMAEEKRGALNYAI